MKKVAARRQYFGLENTSCNPSFHRATAPMQKPQTSVSTPRNMFMLQWYLYWPGEGGVNVAETVSPFLETRFTPTLSTIICLPQPAAGSAEKSSRTGEPAFTVICVLSLPYGVPRRVITCSAPAC